MAKEDKIFFAGFVAGILIQAIALIKFADVVWYIGSAILLIGYLIGFFLYKGINKLYDMKPTQRELKDYD